MARGRIAMREVRDILRLSSGEGPSSREVARSLGVPFTTVTDHWPRAELAGFTPPLPVDHPPSFRLGFGIPAALAGHPGAWFSPGGPEAGGSCGTAMRLAER